MTIAATIRRVVKGDSFTSLVVGCLLSALVGFWWFHTFRPGSVVLVSFDQALRVFNRAQPALCLGAIAWVGYAAYQEWRSAPYRLPWPTLLVTRPLYVALSVFLFATRGAVMLILWSWTPWGAKLIPPANSPTVLLAVVSVNLAKIGHDALNRRYGLRVDTVA